MIGKTISHYKILEKLGEGAMGEVYKAEDKKLNRMVALKFLPSHLTRDKEATERFRREAQAAAGLNHPSIVTIYEIGEFEDQIFISMEYIEGETLKTKIKDQRLKIKWILEIAQQIGEGLAKAHEKGIIHRDIKPDNVIISQDNQVKIVDFGLAKLRGAFQLTRQNSTLGTLHYMSPQQIKGDKINQQADIWSVGVMLYEMITAQLPFEGEYEQTVMYAILNEDPKPVTNLPAPISMEMTRLLNNLLKKNLQERYQKMTDVISDLRVVQERLQAPNVQESVDRQFVSIAILPFMNISADPENEYFSDGLTEELINTLTGIKDFRVVARTSAFTFKGKQVDIREIGVQLNVQYVLEGSVRKSGNRVRITAQLIAVEDGYHLWSEKYDRDLEDVFAIQDEIAYHISEKLQSEFTRAYSLSRKVNRPDVGAYELYLKGRYYFNKFSPGWTLRAQVTFSEAIVQDPSFALAYAGLADTYVFLTNPIGLLDGREALPKARDAAERALGLNPNLSEAYASLGSVATYLDWGDSEKAYKCFEKAVELNPDNVNARLLYEIALSILEQNYDKALHHLNYALEIDPLNLLILLRKGYLYVYKYEYDTAIHYFKKIISIEPEVVAGHHGLVDVYGLKGEYELAFSEGEIARKLGNEGPPFLAVLGLYYGRGGERKKAQDILSTLLKRYETEPISPFWIAVIYMGLQEFDEMYAWFDMAIEKHDSNLLYTFAPPFDPIREDSRFKELRKKMRQNP